MGLAKSTRMKILLGIDLIFFVVEIVVGYSVHSLALVADSFHMLNDILSLCVGLWAVNVASQKKSSKTFTYGWQRAETLGALVNGIFLIALCVTIFLDAVQRFFEPQQVSKPLLILIVGSVGLASNVAGLFLFHDHGHAHGQGEGEGHTHKSDALGTAEEGQQTKGIGGHTQAISDEAGNIADVLPQATVGNWPKSDAMQKAPKEGTSDPKKSKGKEFTSTDEDDSTITPNQSTSPLSIRKSSVSQRRHTRNGSRNIFSSVDDINIHPASFRREFIASSKYGGDQPPAMDESESSSAVQDHENEASERSPLLGNAQPNGKAQGSRRKSRRGWQQDSDEMHEGHHHCQPKGKGKSHGHSHHDLNMRGVFLHVMGDALGNVGVIASALFIWLTSFSWRYYADPLVSLVITGVILFSAIPLCLAAGRILLQAVPSHISVDEITQDIQDLPGIVSCHHLHVWQLSDVKLVASLHIQVDFDFKGEGTSMYMRLVRNVQRCLREYGIHSSTIQPEYCLDDNHRHISAKHSDDEDDQGEGHPSKSKTGSKKGSRVSSLRSEPDACLLDCEDTYAEGKQCCPTTGPNGGT